jgi:hypothetical protein
MKRYLKKNTRPGFIPLSILCFLLVMGFGRYLWLSTNPELLSVEALGASSRMINGTFGAVLTAMALIITLASNLYTPGLVKVFVRHPIIVAGMSFIVGTNIILVLANLFTPKHPLYIQVLEASFVLSCFTMASIIPYLYYISQFLRPSYFLPLLKSQAFVGINSLEKGSSLLKHHRQVFDNIDVIANIFLTAAKRDDRQLMRLVMVMLHEILERFLLCDKPKRDNWRNDYPRFTTGLFNEGKNYLVSTKSWPEAYILGKYIQLLKGITSVQDEVIAEATENIQGTLALSVENQREEIVEMHVMILNVLTRMAIEDKNPIRLEGMFYNYRIMIQVLHDSPDKVSAAFASWEHYCLVADKKGIDFAYETFLYECGLLILEYSKRHDKNSLSLYKMHILEYWQHAASDGGKHELVSYRSAIRTFWEAKANGSDTLANLILDTFLKSIDVHSEILNDMLAFNTPLHWELSDRMLRFTYLSPKAEELALEYIKERKMTA